LKPNPPLPKIPSHQREFREALSEDELAEYYTVLEESGIPEPTWTILKLLPRTGLRIAEICNLTHGDLVKKKDHLGFEILGKGAKNRWVPLSREALQILTNYLDSGFWKISVPEGTEEPPLGAPLFPSPRYVEDPILPGAVRRHLRELRGQLSGYGCKVTPHVLRHCWATGAVRRGVPLVAIRDILGHSTIKTTEIYLNPTVEDLVAAVD